MNECHTPLHAVNVVRSGDITQARWLGADEGDYICRDTDGRFTVVLSGEAESYTAQQVSQISTLMATTADMYAEDQWQYALHFFRGEEEGCEDHNEDATSSQEDAPFLKALRAVE